MYVLYMHTVYNSQRQNIFAKMTQNLAVLEQILSGDFWLFNPTYAEC